MSKRLSKKLINKICNYAVGRYESIDNIIQSLELNMTENDVLDILIENGIEECSNCQCWGYIEELEDDETGNQWLCTDCR